MKLDLENLDPKQMRRVVDIQRQLQALMTFMWERKLPPAFGFTNDRDNPNTFEIDGEGNLSETSCVKIFLNDKKLDVYQPEVEGLADTYLCADIDGVRTDFILGAARKGQDTLTMSPGLIRLGEEYKEEE